MRASISITQSIHRGAHSYGEKAALIYAERTTSYQDLLQEVARCAAALVPLDPVESSACPGIIKARRISHH